MLIFTVIPSVVQISPLHIKTKSKHRMWYRNTCLEEINFSSVFRSLSPPTTLDMYWYSYRQISFGGSETYEKYM